MRFFFVFLSLLLSALLLWGCAPEQSGAPSDTSFASSSPPSEGDTEGITAAVTTGRPYPTADDGLEYKLYEFLDALVSGDTEKLIFFGGVRSPEAYAFWEGTDVAGYEILSRAPCERVGREETFAVELDITSSAHELFPIGRSVWNITTLYSESGFFEPIRPADTAYEDIGMVTFAREDYSAAVNFCYYFTVELDGYLSVLPDGRTCSDFNQIVPDVSRKDIAYPVFTEEEKEKATWFSTMMCRFILQTGKATAETYMDTKWMTIQAYKTLGIDTADFTRSSGYNAETGRLAEHFLGGYWKFAALVSEEAGENGYITVVLDWYADTLLLAKACTLKYTLRPIEDGFQLVSVEELYDAGYELASGST